MSARVDSLREAVRSRTAFGKHDAKLIKDVNQKLGQAIDDCRKIVLDKRAGKHVEGIERIGRQLNSAQEQLDIAVRLSEKWNRQLSDFSARVAEFHARSVRIPGALFQKEVMKHEEEVERESKKAHEAKDRKNVENCLANVEKYVIKLGACVQIAEETRLGIDELDANLDSLDPLEISNDPVTLDAYQGIRTSIPRSQNLMREGNYPAAHNILKQNLGRYRELSELIARRHRYARAEIDLWLHRPSVAAKFDLRSFPENLSAEHVVRWHEMRLEIETQVLGSARKKKREYAEVMKQEDPALGIIDPWAATDEEIMGFASAVVKRQARMPIARQAEAKAIPSVGPDKESNDPFYFVKRK